MMRAPSRPRPRLCPVPPAPWTTRRVLRPLPCSFLLVLLATAATAYYTQRRVSDVARGIACMYHLCLMRHATHACMYHLCLMRHAYMYHFCLMVSHLPLAIECM